MVLQILEVTERCIWKMFRLNKEKDAKRSIYKE